MISVKSFNSLTNFVIDIFCHFLFFDKFCHFFYVLTICGSQAPCLISGQLSPSDTQSISLITEKLNNLILRYSDTFQNSVKIDLMLPPIPKNIFNY
jgi:hypothetical protein